jgi:hypothetical protein
MIRALLDHGVATAVVGGVVVAAAGGAAYALDAPEGFTLVVGLAAGAPLLNLGGFASEIDTDNYLDRKGRTGVAADAALAVAGALTLGAAAAALVGTVGATGALVPAAVAAATFLGGNAPFVARNREFRDA